MPNIHKAALLNSVREQVGELHKLAGSNSLFSVGDDLARLYLRYSKVHPDGRTFFGLRDVDLRELAGHNSYICFFVDDGSAPLFVPYADFEELFQHAEPASDGQYKAQLNRPTPLVRRVAAAAGPRSWRVANGKYWPRCVYSRWGLSVRIPARAWRGESYDLGHLRCTCPQYIHNAKKLSSTHSVVTWVHIPAKKHP